jgi:hypothetical protein
MDQARFTTILGVKQRRLSLRLKSLTPLGVVDATAHGVGPFWAGSGGCGSFWVVHPLQRFEARANSTQRQESGAKAHSKI